MRGWWRLWISVTFGLMGLLAAPAVRAQVCDPYAGAPRPSCSWDTTACNWVCPGYTGGNVTAVVLQPPASAGTVTVNMQVACIPQIHSCSVSGATTATETATQHCQLLAGLVASGSCAGAGFVVAAGSCVGPRPALTVSNSACNTNPMALGISNAQFPFDQSYQGALADGEREEIVAGAVAPSVPALSEAWRAILALLLGLVVVSFCGRLASRRRAAAAGPFRASAPWRG
jgi:hypothetical protein